MSVVTSDEELTVGEAILCTLKKFPDPVATLANPIEAPELPDGLPASGPCLYTKSMMFVLSYNRT